MDDVDVEVLGIERVCVVIVILFYCVNGEVD